MTAKCMLVVQMLGGFSVTCGGGVISESSKRSQNVWRLFKYLVANRKRLVPVEDLIELLWADEGCTNPSKALQNLVYRLRTLLERSGCGEELVLFKNGGYCWNNEAEAQIDLQQFEDACERAKEPGLGDAQRTAQLERAIALYTGDFLPDSTFDEWALTYATYYKRLYMECAYALSGLYEAAGQDGPLLKLCEDALSVDPYDEHMHAAYIRVLHRMCRTGQAVAHYERASATLQRELGIGPSEELRAAYHDIYNASLHLNMTIDEICESLSEMNVDGAFVCDYDIFKNLYRLEVRTAERSGQAVFLGLFTMLSPQREVLGEDVLLDAMKVLRGECLHLLRKGDVVTQISKSQIALLLPALTIELGERIMERIVRSFQRAYDGEPVLLDAKIKPVDMRI